MAKSDQRVPEGRRRKAPPQRIPRPANDNTHPEAKRRLVIALAALGFSALVILALSMAGWR
ncbi:protein of unknown function [Magnetospirillum sp. XM-1]|nr:protein of unknown function [Magnetospirillum sp. XM-1]